eukprot:5345197-Amphidinium_carterae.1
MLGYNVHCSMQCMAQVTAFHNGQSAHPYNFDSTSPATRFDIGISHGIRVCVDNDRETTKRDIEENKTNENKEYENKKYNDENNEEDDYDREQEKMQTMIIYKMENNAIGMMQKVSIKLPSPTQFDRSVHNVNIEDIIDNCTKSKTVILLGDIQGKYTANEVKKYNTQFPNALQEGGDDYDEYMDMTVNIKKMRGDI